MILRPRFILLFIVFVVLGVYYPSIFAPFNSVDDHTLINILINQENYSLFQLFFPKTSGYYYRPLLRLTFWLDQWLWGLHESFMHLGNILLHTMNALLVYAIASRSAARNPNAQMAGGFAALLFALHPLNCEAVNWVSGRTDLLAGFFILGSTWFLLKAGEGRKIAYLIAASASLLLACLAKETAIFFVPAALFMIYCGRGEVSYGRGPLSFHSLVSFVAIIVAGISYFAIRSIALSKGDVGIRHAAGQIIEKNVDYLYYIRTAVKVGGFYLKKLFYPWPLNFGITKVPDHYLVVGVILIVLLAYLLYRRDHISSFFVAGICVGSSALIVAFGRMAWTPIAERYMYIPSAFMIIGATLLISDLQNTLRLTRQFYSLAAFAILAVFAVSTTMRNLTWQDNLSLFTDTAEKSPDFIPAMNDKAIALIKKGKKEEGFSILKGLDAPESLKNWEIAALNNAAVLLVEGKVEEARNLIRTMAGREGRNQLRAIEMLLRVDEKLLSDQGRKDRGETGREVVNLLEAMQKKTGNPFYYYRLGQTHLALENWEEARKAFELAYEKSPATAYYREPAGKLAKKMSEKGKGK